MVVDACHLIFGKPDTIEEDGVVRPLLSEERQQIAQAFLEGSVARLAQWWREEERENVAGVLNALERDDLRVLATVALGQLADLGFAIAEFPEAPPGTDPRTN
jgi:hypothetical protein